MPAKRATRTRAGPDPQREFVEGFAAAVRHARKARGYTQAALAGRCGVATNTLARIERAELCPSVYVAHRLAEALGTGLDSLTCPVREAPPLVRRKGATRPATRSRAR